MNREFYNELKGKTAENKKYLIAGEGYMGYFNGPRALVEERDLAKIYSFTEAVQFLEKYDTEGCLNVTPIDIDDKNDGLDELYEAFPNSELVIFDNDASYYSIFEEVLSQKVENLKQVKEKAKSMFVEKFYLR